MSQQSFKEMLPPPRQRSHGQRVQIAACRVVMALSVFTLAGTLAVRRQLRQQDDRLDAQLAQSQKEAAKGSAVLAALSAQQVNLERRAELAAGPSHDALRSSILALLTNALPPRTSLLHVELDGTDFAIDPAAAARKTSAASTSTPSSIAATELKLIGVAQTDMQVKQYAATLARFQSFGDLHVTSSDLNDAAGHGSKRFQIRVKLLPGAADALAPARISDLRVGDESLSLAR